MVFQVWWDGVFKEMEGEENHVCGWLTEFEPVGIFILYDSPGGSELQDKLCEEGFSLLCDFWGKFSFTHNLFILYVFVFFFPPLRDAVCLSAS